MSASVKGTTVDMLRHVLHNFIREETLTVTSNEIVNQHYLLPLSSVHGSGTLPSSDAQRFKVRASILLASAYPRYYGYYKKAVGLYTHTSDQYSVFATQAISCGPREALYVLDGLLKNNTILKIRDLKDQQLYRVNRKADYGVFTPLLTKTVDMSIVEEQWEAMLRVALSLKQLQLNKGEYRHKLSRRVFFADQGEFTTGNYEEIMNKATCLSLVSNAILYWNTIKINEIVEGLKAQGEIVEDKTLSHIIAALQACHSQWRLLCR